MVPETIEILSIAVSCQTECISCVQLKTSSFESFLKLSVTVIFVLKGILLMSQGNVMTLSVEN